MKHRKLSKNANLQKVFRYLKGARGRGDGTVTTRDIIIRTGVIEARISDSLVGDAIGGICLVATIIVLTVSAGVLQ